MTNSFFVRYDGDDLNNCGNWNMPCRTVRHAVKMSNDGDQIYIDYEQGRPYMECQNVTQSECSIELTQSVSLLGINGKAEIRCTKSCKFFKIMSSSFYTIKIKFSDLVISNSNTVAELGVGARSELVFQNALIRDTFHGIYSKHSTDSSILITNSRFENNFNWGIYLRCPKLTMEIKSSIFKLSPLFFTNIGNKPALWQKTELFFRDTVFDFQNTQRCTDMVAVKPFAAILNVTIIESQFKNHIAVCRPKDHISTLHINDVYSKVRNITFIFLSNLLIENNYNNWATLPITVVYFGYTKIEVMIRDSIFRNNSAALRLRVLAPHFGRNSPGKLTTHIENNTFVDNTYEQLNKANGAAAIYFASGRSRVSSCRFFDNKAGGNPYTAVVTIPEKARVTFFNSYFESRQTKVPSNQLFASGSQPLYFVGKNTFNLVALNEAQSVFIRMPTATGSGVIIKKNFKILCPQGYTLNQQRQCMVIKTGILCYYINVRCEQCPTRTYTLDRGELIFNKSNGIQCQLCPRGGNCARGVVTAKPNFWGYKTRAKVVFVQCPQAYCCENEDCPSIDSCHGNRSGTLCGQCPEGMSESLFFTQCISNIECTLNYFFILGTIGLLILYLVFFLYHKEIVSFLGTSLLNNHLSLSSPNGMIKIFFYYYQVCNLLRSSVASSKNGQFIHYFENVITRVMNVVLVNVPSLNCPFRNLRAVPKAVILHSVGFCLLGLLCLLYLVSKLLLILRKLKSGSSSTRTELQYITTTRSDQMVTATKSSFSQRVASAFTYISLLMYTSTAQLCLSLLHCVPIGDYHVLFLDGNIKCYQSFQYFLLSYMISSILPFCLVPVLGSYLLKFDRIGVKQFYAACILPLPFCCFWMYLLLKGCRWGNRQGNYNTIEQNDNAVRHEQGNDETQSLSSEDITFPRADSNETTSQKSKSAILSVLVGPFRPHESFMCFPSSNIPWEGCLIFRRLVLIIALTYVYDIQLRLFLALTVCVVILIFHMFVNPFQRKRDNILESFSLSIHVVLCGLYLVKALYYGEDYSSSLLVLKIIENILIITPLSIIMFIVIFSIVIKLVFGLKLCVSVLIRNVSRLARFLV